MAWKPEFSVRLLTAISQAEACRRLRISLHEQDLDIMDELDLSSRVKDRTGLSFGEYTILMVWFPLPAYHALLATPEAGAFIPFHLVVCSCQGKTLVSYVSPEWLAETIDRIEFRLMAKDIAIRLERAVSVLEGEKAICREPELRLVGR